MNSVILAFNSSGEGNDGGGGFCCDMWTKTSCQRALVATIRLKSDSQPRDSFILTLLPIPSLTLARVHARALL